MKRIYAVMLGVSLSVGAMAQGALVFEANAGVKTKMKDFGRKHFFYIVAGGDQKAYGGMQDLAKVLKENEARIDSASWSAKLPGEEQERLVWFGSYGYEKAKASIDESLRKRNEVNFDLAISHGIC